MVEAAENIRRHLHNTAALVERREGVYQLVIPIFHEDGDTVDVYVERCPERSEWFRISDCGMTLMRLSCSFDINSPTRENIYNTILSQNKVQDKDGLLYAESSPEMLYQNVMQFIGCQQKILNMRLWQKESVRSLFYEHLDQYIEIELHRFNPRKKISPLPDYPVVEVDYMFSGDFSKKPFFLFGVTTSDKAKSTAIALLELQKAKMPYIGLVVHEDFASLSRKEQVYLTENADKQFPSFANFKERAQATMERLAA